MFVTICWLYFQLFLQTREAVHSATASATSLGCLVWWSWSFVFVHDVPKNKYQEIAKKRCLVVWEICIWFLGKLAWIFFWNNTNYFQILLIWTIIQVSNFRRTWDLAFCIWLLGWFVSSFVCWRHGSWHGHSFEKVQQTDFQYVSYEPLIKSLTQEEPLAYCIWLPAVICTWLLRSFIYGCYGMWYGYSFETANKKGFQISFIEPEIKSLLWEEPENLMYLVAGEFCTWLPGNMS